MRAQMEIYDTPDSDMSSPDPNMLFSLPSPIRPHNFGADDIQEVPIIVPPLTWYSRFLDKMNRHSVEAEVTKDGRCLLDSVEYFLDPRWKKTLQKKWH